MMVFLYYGNHKINWNFCVKIVIPFIIIQYLNFLMFKTSFNK